MFVKSHLHFRSKKFSTLINTKRFEWKFFGIDYIFIRIGINKDFQSSL